MTDDNTLYYMRQRYYNPQIKRFINQDILIGSIGNSASLNRYSYVEGNPISYTDPFGLSPFNYISQPLHRTLDWAGMLPIVGVGFDWINAGIYLMEGKPTYALFAAFSSIGIGDGVKFLIKNGKKSIAGISITALFCETDAGSGLKEDIGVLVDDYATYQGYDQMSKDELALTLTIDLVLGAKSGYDDLNIKKKKVDVDVDDFVPDNATNKVNKIDGDAVPGATILVSKGEGELFAHYASRAKPDEGYYDVIIHGSVNSDLSTRNRFSVYHNNMFVEIDQRALATYVKKDPNYKGEPIRLISCATGADVDGIAKNFANKMGVKVKAPSDIVWAFPNGTLTIGKTQDIDDGVWNIFEPGY